MTIQYIENWTLLGEDDFYVNLALCVLRALYTNIKGLKPSVSHHTEAFFWAQRHELLSPTRFDTIATTIKKSTHKNMFNSKYNDLMK
jgi:hypothetical protein